MSAFFKYLGAFCLITIALSLAFAAYSLYQSVQIFNRILTGADSYTCKQFLYDMEQPGTEKLSPMFIAVAAYGVVQSNESTEQREDELMQQGALPAIKKVTELCRNKPMERVLNLYAATIVPPVSATSVDTPADSPVSPSESPSAEVSNSLTNPQ
ncbi:MAG: hypothetical protein DI585_03550 [Pseudomonas fluorescens]|nr:MAG: hypothetical protein DI585_03550 [Pseudomonas fluorescens]